MDETPPASTLPEPDLRPENIWYHYNLLDSEQKAVYLELYENLVAYIENDEDTELFSLTIENTASTMDGRGIVMRMAWDNPAIALYFGSHIDVTDENGRLFFHDISTPDMQDFGDITDIRNQIREIELAADDFLADISPYLSDYDKYHAIAEKLAAHIEYNDSHGAPEQRLKDFLLDMSVYGGLVNRLCACEGFAKTYQHLCHQAGLFCVDVSGNTYAGDHAWNIIRLDDGYYHVDVTWMQTDGDRYFCLTDSQIAVDHRIISQYQPECSSVKYAYDGGKVP